MHPNILIIEDHAALRRALRDYLEISFPQYKVVDVESCEKAIGWILKESPRLIIIDFNINNMNGLQATRRIKSAAPNAKIIVLTFHEDSHYHSAISLAGGHANVSKSSLVKKLIPTMTSLLNGSPIT